jgi:hypothetical protein
MTTKPIRIEPNQDLLRVLTALGIQWNSAPSGNGEGNWTLVEMSDDAADHLLMLCDQLTDLRVRYLEAMNYNQLPLWEKP